MKAVLFLIYLAASTGVHAQSSANPTTNTALVVSEGFQKGGIPSYGGNAWHKASFYVFPNPVQNKLKLHITSESPRTIKVNMHDASGRLMDIATRQLHIRDEWNETIDCTELPKGAYFLTMRDLGSGEVQTLRVEKTR